MPSAQRLAANPFALMLDPAAVLAQVEHSERLERLQRRICRPLDKPLVPLAEGQDEGVELAGHDEAGEGGAQGL